MVTSTILTLVVIPAVYSLWRERQLRVEAARNRVHGTAAGAPWAADTR